MAAWHSPLGPSPHAACSSKSNILPISAVMDLLIRKRAAGYVCRSCTRQVQREIRLRRSYSSSARPDIYDVVCVGGGPAGLSLLTALRANPVTSHLRIALVEAQDLSKIKSWKLPPDRFSNRCSSLTPASVRYLDQIGAWHHLDQTRVQDYHEMQVWDGVTDARIEFDTLSSSPTSGPDTTIAYMTENLNLTSGLLKRLEELGGVSTYDNAKVEQITLGAEHPESNLDLREWPVIHLSGGKQLHARLLVGADGANSPVRSFAGIQARGWDYNRHGVVATLALEEQDFPTHQSFSPSGKIAYQRFLPTGPVALLPLPGNFATLVWSTTPENAALLKSLPPKEFIAMVNAAFRLSPVDLSYLHSPASSGTPKEEEYSWRMEHTHINPLSVPQTIIGVQENSIASFPLKFRHADTYIAERVALVGDAAHTIHPLAGQGLNQGQGDIQSLARTISYAVEHGMDIGTTMALESYLSERYAANHVVMGVCDKLHKLYSFESGPLVGLRSLGLRAVNGWEGVKSFLMRQASGGGSML
ncbi:hypothetical protein QBC37DRAFT_415816 [Rhypophila decipiens]|uniref:Ubiquinone biosynthesis monooxygenase COQ6, mitochondrial n=1 Tax=Rhypophila decipiens TaxID=261697 RepID=A0AAN6YHZ1_9PEZI|nr:hypothetical protein QBC37DRAFT_415816 [Rhypophila decipiens]